MTPAFPKPVARPKAPRRPLARKTRLQARTPIANPRATMKRSWMKKRLPRRLFRVDREVLVNDFDGRGPRLEVKEGHDIDRLRWTRRQPCAVRMTIEGADRCKGPREACHEGKRKPGVGLKSPDQLAFSMCRWHHRCWTTGRGVFAGMSKERRREWGDERGAEALSRYLSHGTRRAA